ncbi:unnamed protein product [Acidocella sp. C78]|nr:unnamed protein product [Acidocella sp. C78]
MTANIDLVQFYLQRRAGGQRKEARNPAASRDCGVIARSIPLSIDLPGQSASICTATVA